MLFQKVCAVSFGIAAILYFLASVEFELQLNNAEMKVQIIKKEVNYFVLFNE